MHECVSVCVCVSLCVHACVCNGNVKCHTEVAPLLLLSRVFLETWGGPGGFLAGPQSRSASTFAAVCFHSLRCVCQLIMTNCSCHRLLAEPPCSSAVARLAWCSPPPRISHCPASNENQRTDSLAHLILPPNWQNERTPRRQRGKSQF